MGCKKARHVNYDDKQRLESWLLYTWGVRHMQPGWGWLTPNDATWFHLKYKSKQYPNSFPSRSSLRLKCFILLDFCFAWRFFVYRNLSVVKLWLGRELSRLFSFSCCPGFPFTLPPHEGKSIEEHIRVFPRETKEISLHIDECCSSIHSRQASAAMTLLLTVGKDGGEEMAFMEKRSS